MHTLFWWFETLLSYFFVYWKHNNRIITLKSLFQTSSVWSGITCLKWCHLFLGISLYGLARIFRHSFILWLVVNKKLRTQDRVSKWIKVGDLCPLCRKFQDCHSHIFFDCDYAMGVWDSMKCMARLDNAPSDYKIFFCSRPKGLSTNLYGALFRG